jgi:uncharacterized protein YdeI (YjbR/CyaY-like superfamily)
VKPRFFATPEKFRAWLARNHGKTRELLVGFHKKASGKPSIDWPQSLEPAELTRFKANARAWKFFSGLAPSYRYVVFYWINSARKPETRNARLARLIAASAAAKKL